MKTHCPHGHDIRIVGRAANGRCRECARGYMRSDERKARRKELAKRLCSRGHDLEEVGTYGGYRCRVCQRESVKRRQAEIRAGKAKKAGPVANKGGGAARTGRRTDEAMSAERTDKYLRLARKLENAPTHWERDEIKAQMRDMREEMHR